MKKIGICTTVSLTLKTFVVPTAEYLHKKFGYDITLICNEDNDFEKSLPEYIHFIPVKMARGVDLSGFKSVLDFIKIFRREKFDMVQYSTPNAACYASIAAKLCRVPIRLYCQWGMRYIGLSGISRKILKLIEKMICRNSTDIRVASPLNKEFAVSEGIYKADKAAVVGNGGTIGVDMQIYNIEKKQEWRQEIRSKYEVADSDFVFGFSGRISADKGCMELFTAFKELTEGGLRAKLLIVGPFNDDCGIERKLVNWAKTSENIIFSGMVDGSQMCKYYSAMDVLVHPTYREGFGMVLQEAGALAVPVITTKIPGASEVMEDGVSCILVAPKSVSELENAMRMLISHQDRGIEIGRAAYKRTKQYYDRSIMLENQMLDYRTILEAR